MQRSCRYTCKSLRRSQAAQPRRLSSHPRSWKVVISKPNRLTPPTLPYRLQLRCTNQNSTSTHLRPAVTRHGRKRKGKDVQAINECIECGEDVDEIGQPENAIQCANIGCETRWVSCSRTEDGTSGNHCLLTCVQFHRDCYNVSGNAKWVCPACKASRQPRKRAKK